MAIAHRELPIMQRFKRWLIFLLLLLIFVLSVGFSMWNTTPVTLSFGFHEFSARPMSFWLIITFCIGGLIGITVGAGIVRDARLRRRIKALEKELEKRPRFKASEID